MVNGHVRPPWLGEVRGTGHLHHILGKRGWILLPQGVQEALPLLMRQQSSCSPRTHGGRSLDKGGSTQATLATLKSST